MASVSTYLNFMGTTEEAFRFYAGAFGTQPTSVMYMRDAPQAEGMPPVPEHEGGKVMHMQLPILGGHVLMGTDVLASRGHKLTVGNNVTLHLSTDTRAQADELFAALSEGGDERQKTPLHEAFWGGYFGTCVDKYGVRWMFNCDA